MVHKTISVFCDVGRLTMNVLTNALNLQLFIQVSWNSEIKNAPSETLLFIH
jgi:hypothetical protein